MKRGTVLLLVFFVVLALAGAASVGILRGGLSARAKPSALEAAVARAARRLAVPSGAHTAVNTVADSPQVQREGRLHFADHCALCHGNDGSGNTPIGQGLYPKPPDLRAAETQNLSDGDLFWVIENGVRLTGMPAFGSGEPDPAGAELTWKLVRFIRHLPALTAEEKLEMERYNPRGPDDRAEEQRENEFLKGGPASSSPNRQPHHH